MKDVAKSPFVVVKNESVCCSKVGCLTITANEQVLPMVGQLKKLRLATEVQLKTFDEGKNKKPNSKRQARTKADKELLPIAPTSSPTIGNTLVVRSPYFSMT